MSDVQIGLEAGEAVIDTVVSPTKPSFFSRLSRELGRRTAPEKVAAEVVVAGAVAVIGLGSTAVNRWVVRPWLIKRWMQNHKLTAVEAMIVSHGYAKTDNEAKQVMADLHYKEKWELPVRYKDFERINQPSKAAQTPPSPPTPSQESAEPASA